MLWRRRTYLLLNLFIGTWYYYKGYLKKKTCVLFRVGLQKGCLFLCNDFVWRLCQAYSDSVSLHRFGFSTSTVIPHADNNSVLSSFWIFIPCSSCPYFMTLATSFQVQRWIEGMLVDILVYSWFLFQRFTMMYTIDF